METHLQSLALGQAEVGAQVGVVCVNHRGRDGEDVTWSRFRTTPTVEEHDGPVHLTRVGRVASLAKVDVCTRLPGVLRSAVRDADVVHVHAPNPTMFLALTTLRVPGALVITHHSDVVRQRYLQHAFRPVERHVYARADRIFSDSPPYVDGSPVLTAFRRKVGVLPLGIDLRPFRELAPEASRHRDQLRAEFGEPLWLAVGRLVYYKGLEVALQALAEVPGTLLVVGTGPLEQSLRVRAAALGVAGRVVWRGHTGEDELVGAYHAATALWFPSVARSEGFGLVQVEAMACGCPVLNTAIPHSGVSWVSRHEETGLTVPVNDASALAAAARRLLDEPGLRDRLGRAAATRAEQEFEREMMVRRSLAMYESALR
jgi:rhamnosyl/mannosyltransferase